MLNINQIKPNPYPANVENMVISYASKWHRGFNSAIKELIFEGLKLRMFIKFY